MAREGAGLRAEHSHQWWLGVGCSKDKEEATL